MEIITAANGFVGGKLNLAHAAGTYIPADVRFRLSKMVGHTPTIFLTGVDVHGRRAGRQARRGDGAPEDIVESFSNYYRAELGKLNIAPTHFITTDDPKVEQFTLYALSALQAAGLVTRQLTNSMWCRTCADGLSKSEVRAFDKDSRPVNLKRKDVDYERLGAIRCDECGGTDVDVQQSFQHMLALPRNPDEQAHLAEFASPTLKKMLRGLAVSDFDQWEFTRDRYYGIAMPDEPDKSLYLWFAALISKVLPLATLPDEIGRRLSNVRFNCFLGKNIVHYYSIIFPILLSRGFGGTGWRLALSVRGFCDLAASAEMLDIDTALTFGTPDEIRFFCSYAAKDDVKDFVLVREQLDIWRHSVLIRTFVRFLTRATEALRQIDSRAFDWGCQRHPHQVELERLIERNETRRVLLALEEFVRTSLSRPNKEPSEIFSEYRLVYDVLSCYMPHDIRRHAIYPLDSDGFLSVAARP